MNRSALVLGFIFALSGLPAGAYDLPVEPALPPPPVVRPDTAPPPDLIPKTQALPPAALVEWAYHKTADGAHPDGNEQSWLWLMNRARANPSQEGLWLATSSESDIAYGRDYFSVNLTTLQQEFNSYAAKPPAAFDARLYQAAYAHSQDLIARNAQDHTNQFARIDASGFRYLAARGNVYSYARNSLFGHAGLNIDWGGTDGSGMQTGRGHRQAIMSLDGSYTNVGLAMVPENNQSTQVGPFVFTGNYCQANTSYSNHFNRFIVGTVWQDLNGNDRYDPGEGIGGVQVTPDRGTYYAVTAAGGGYAIPATETGVYTLTFGGAGVSGQQQATVGTASVLSDFRIGSAAVNTRLLAGLNATGQIFYTTNLRTWTNVPGGLSQLVAADLNGDGWGDLAGLNAAGQIWYTTDLGTWTNIPGGLTRLVTGDFDGDGAAELAGLNASGQIWYTIDLRSWTNVPGGLSQLVAADLTGDGRDDLAGLNTAGQIWYTADLRTWTSIPGGLTQLVTGDFDGDGAAELAGLNSAGQIWYTADLRSWTNVPGGLSQLVAADLDGDGGADLAGLNAAGQIWYTTNLRTWTSIPGSLGRLVAGDLHRDGSADLVGVNSAGQVWYTTDRQTWANVPGILSTLATE